MAEHLQFLGFAERFIGELKRSGYSKSVCAEYGRIATRLVDYASEKAQEIYSVDFAHRFLNEVYPVESGLHPVLWTNKQRFARRAVKLMDVFATNGITLLCRQSTRTGLDDESVALIGKYSGWLDRNGYRNSTTRGHTSVARNFIRHLLRIQRKPEELTDKDIAQYLNTSNGYSHSTISATLYSLKNFARFLFETNVIETDIVPLFPEGHKYRLANIVSVWKPGTVEKILAAVDRGSPIGKRDYAIILIAARLGLRMGDIFGLRLDSINWNSSRIETIQSKTGQPITLPLPDDVGWAIIDYLKHGRPQIDSQYVFFCHSKNALGKPMSGTFDNTLAKYIRQARVQISEGQKHGMHSLRHTLACRLLEAKTPLPVISEILGQISPDAIEKYLKVDVEMLRQCALNPQEVFADAN
jgi:site-specific recombinase XerD